MLLLESQDLISSLLDFSLDLAQYLFAILLFLHVRIDMFLGGDLGEIQRLGCYSNQNFPCESFVN